MLLILHISFNFNYFFTIWHRFTILSLSVLPEFTTSWARPPTTWQLRQASGADLEALSSPLLLKNLSRTPFPGGPLWRRQTGEPRKWPRASAFGKAPGRGVAWAGPDGGWRRGSGGGALGAGLGRRDSGEASRSSSRARPLESPRRAASPAPARLTPCSRAP